MLDLECGIVECWLGSEVWIGMCRLDVRLGGSNSELGVRVGCGTRSAGWIANSECGLDVGLGVRVG